MIAGLEAISEGEIVIDGKVVNPLEPRDRGCAKVSRTTRFTRT
jgi:sn-glycerol 3-phosphate transport system ATP-binding protein